MNIPLKVALIERGIRQMEISHLLGIDPSKLSKIFNGWISADKQTQLRIARLLGRPVQDLFPADSQTAGTQTAQPLSL